ncbi:hypothetical protein EFBL_2837 [Effusibacillus lacus]|uniref:Uncharacterized protein n=1 Tax=Effusibacillus lacus TaxID=1348429 RepID=A0A292YQI8_9BACL|nr:hypothetical protein EFBL_2837 [Effusibacillus lacus]
MELLSDQTEEELLNALKEKQSGLFVINGNLVSVEGENFETNEEDVQNIDLPKKSKNVSGSS